VTRCPLGDADQCGDQGPCPECPRAFCQWAGCTRPSAVHEDGWHHCRDHIFEHRTLAGEESQPDLAARIRLLHSYELRDTEIAEELGRNVDVVRYQREKMGLPGHRKGREPSRECGTEAAYRRHLRHSETPCHECREVSLRARQDRRVGAAR
jgi:hypothetical protein